MTGGSQGQPAAAASAVDGALNAATQKNWAKCWGSMVFKDLYGYPLWEKRLHDVLQAVFPELSSIFLYYRGSSVQGTESIGNATKIGLMEMLALAKDTELCTADFPSAELERHFSTANAEDAIASSGSAERHKVLPGRATSPRRSSSPRSPSSPPSGRPGSARGRGSKKAAADMQLNLFEFVNFLVRVAFWRANPTWGAKDNNRDLTPVPEATEILLQQCILPKATRDESEKFRLAIAEDDETQQVLREYRPKLQHWLRPILAKIRGYERPNWRADLRVTYADWYNLMDGTQVLQECGMAP